MWIWKVTCYDTMIGHPRCASVIRSTITLSLLLVFRSSMNHSQRWSVIGALATPGHRAGALAGNVTDFSFFSLNGKIFGIPRYARGSLYLPPGVVQRESLASSIFPHSLRRNFVKTNCLLVHTVSLITFKAWLCKLHLLTFMHASEN